MTDQAKRALGVLSLAAAVIAVFVYLGQGASLPTAAACRTVNEMQPQLGGAATCHSAPPHTALIVAAVFGAIGLLFLAASRA